MSKFQLTAKTLKGRNRIREAGTDVVTIIMTREQVIFSNVPGPWALVGFEGADIRTSRWINLKHGDVDFTIKGLD